MLYEIISTFVYKLIKSMREKPTVEYERGHILSVQEAVTKIAHSLSVSDAEVYEALPDLLRLSEEKFSAGHLPAEFRTREDYDECIMVSSTGMDPMGVILKKTEGGLEAETFRRYWQRTGEQ